MIHPQMPVEQAEVVASTAKRSLEETSGGLLSPVIQATGAQQSEAQGLRLSSDKNGGLQTANSLLMQTASSILNIVTEAALVSTCPDGFLPVASRTEGLLTTEVGTSIEPSETHLNSSPAVVSYLSRFPSRSNQFALATQSQLQLKPPDNLVRLCKCLGMNTSAANGWTAISMKPCAAICIFFFCITLCISTLFLNFGIGLLHSSWQPYLGIALVPFFTMEVVMAALFWPNGPMFAKTKLYALLFLVWLCAGGPVPVLTYLGPPAALPFNSLLTNTLLGGAAILVSNVANKLGTCQWITHQSRCPTSALCFLMPMSGRFV
jgi:hypothetical protein